MGSATTAHFRKKNPKTTEQATKNSWQRGGRLNFCAVEIESMVGLFYIVVNVVFVPFVVIRSSILTIAVLHYVPRSKREIVRLTSTIIFSIQ